jgi:hypothetical protein
MSRNRTAILADIEKFNLNPNVPYRKIHGNGRLAKQPVAQEKEIIVEQELTNHSTVVETIVEVQTKEAQIETTKVEKVEEVSQSIVLEEEQKPEPVMKKKGKKQITE